MHKKFFTRDRQMLFFSFLLLATASILSFILEPEKRSIIPYPGIVIPFINTLSAIVCLVVFFIPQYDRPIHIITFIQSIATVLTGYETLGIFLYTALIIMLFCRGYFKKGTKRKLTALLVIWAVTLLGVIPFGLDRVALAYTTSMFFTAFYAFVYEKLSYLLSALMPQPVLEKKIDLPCPGSVLSLTKVGLTQRQAKIVMLYMTNNGASYKNIATTCITSVSTVKAEMSAAFKAFGVKNREELRILLLQYKIKM